MGRSVIAVDVGGRSIKGAVIDVGELEAGAAVGPTVRRPIPVGDGGRAAVIAVRDVVEELRKLAAQRGGAEAAAVALPGVVDEQAGVAVDSENVGWRDVPFRRLLAKWTGLPATIGHDVRAGGLAERRLGAARGLDDVVFLPIGTGIAAALTIGGREHTGGGLAGEIGHVDIGHDRPCACGQRGCLEAFASAAAIARRYSERSGQTTGEAEQVAKRMVAGDPVAEQVWDEAVDALGLAVAWIASVLAPEAIIVGGGLSRAGPLLLDPLRAAVQRRLTFQRRPRLRPAAFGDQAGCVGAALLGSDLLET